MTLPANQPTSQHGRCNYDIFFILQGELSRESLYKRAKETFDKLLDDLVSREGRLKENMDYSYVTKWLLSVRGISEDIV